MILSYNIVTVEGIFDLSCAVQCTFVICKKGMPSLIYIFTLIKFTTFLKNLRNCHYSESIVDSRAKPEIYCYDRVD